MSETYSFQKITAVHLSAITADTEEKSGFHKKKGKKKQWDIKFYIFKMCFCEVSFIEMLIYFKNLINISLRFALK